MLRTLQSKASCKAQTQQVEKRGARHLQPLSCRQLALHKGCKVAGVHQSRSGRAEGAAALISTCPSLRKHNNSGSHLFMLLGHTLWPAAQQCRLFGRLHALPLGLRQRKKKPGIWQQLKRLLGCWHAKRQACGTEFATPPPLSSNTVWNLTLEAYGGSTSTSGSGSRRPATVPVAIHRCRGREQQGSASRP